VFEQQLRGPLLPVVQRPVISFPLAWLRAGGVASATVCANSSTPMVERALGDGGRLGMCLSYYADDHPRGPAGCARDAAVADRADTYVLVEGSVIPLHDLEEILDGHRRSGAPVTTVVEIDRRRAAVGGARRPAPGGIYVFEREVLESVPATGFQDIKQGLLERLYASGERVRVHEVDGVSPRVLDYQSYLSVTGWLAATAVRRADFRDYLPVGEGIRHPTAEVDPTARVIGPVVIGPHARVGPEAVLVGPVSVGAHSRIGASALVARSSVWERCVVGAGALVDRSLLAHAVEVPAGARLKSAVEVVDGAGQVADVLAPTHTAWDEAGSVRVPDEFAILGQLLEQEVAAP
jgi:NDP-sugar pyrophosphorylase family protein